MSNTTNDGCAIAELANAPESLISLTKSSPRGRDFDANRCVKKKSNRRCEAHDAGVVLTHLLSRSLRADAKNAFLESKSRRKDLCFGVSDQIDPNEAGSDSFLFRVRICDKKKKLDKNYF